MNLNFPRHSFPAKEEAIEVKAFVDLHRVSAVSLKAEQHFECLPLHGGCAISLPSAPAIGLNRVLGLRSVEDLEEAYAWMKGKAGNRFLQVDIDTASAEVTDWIKARDLHEHGPGWAKLVRGRSLTGLSNICSLPTRLVQLEEAMRFGSMMCNGFNFPSELAGLWAAIVGKEGWSCYFALDGETPVGTAAMFVSGTCAWLGGGTTIPAFRNRGVQKALIKSRVEHGSRNGVSTFAVETEVPVIGKPNISFDNLEKMGFRHAFNRKNFRL